MATVKLRFASVALAVSKLQWLIVEKVGNNE